MWGLKRFFPAEMGLCESRVHVGMGVKQEVWLSTLTQFLMSSIKQLSFSPSFTFVLSKLRASSAAPVLRTGKQASNSKTGDGHGRSRSLNRNSSDASGDSQAGQQITRQASGPAPAGVRLCSSRSFSSLHTSSLSAAPFMRSSRSLSRLDHSSTTDGIWLHLDSSTFWGKIKLQFVYHLCGNQTFIVHHNVKYF